MTSLRDEICQLALTHMKDGWTPCDVRRIVETAVACMGACAVVIAVMPGEEGRDALIAALTAALPVHVKKRVAEIESGAFDKRRQWS